MQAQAQQAQTDAAQAQARGDYASLIARYGTRLAMAGAQPPLVTASAGTGVVPLSSVVTGRAAGT
jgi:hypothetical protein